MTEIKPTVSLFSVWQRELDRVPVRFATLYIQLLLWLCTLSPTVLISISWLFCHMLGLWLVAMCDMTILWPMSHLLWFCDCHVIFPTLHLSNNLKKKKKKKKRNMNIDLAVLPSHDSMTKFWRESTLDLRTLLAAAMELVMTVILWILSISMAGIKPMWIAISLASIDVTLMAWICSCLMTELLDQIWATAVAMWDFLMPLLTLLKLTEI